MFGSHASRSHAGCSSARWCRSCARRSTKMREEINTVKAENATLKAQMLEQRSPGVEYGGVFEAGGAYRKGVLITHRGSLWLSLAQTAHRPPGDAWKLIVKKGDA